MCSNATSPNTPAPPARLLIAPIAIPAVTVAAIARTSTRSAEQVLHHVAFVRELLPRDRGLLLAEVVHGEARHDLPVALAVRRAGESADDAFGGAVAAVADDAERGPIVLGRHGVQA